MLLPDVSGGIEFLVLKKQALEGEVIFPEVAEMPAHDLEALLNCQHEEPELFKEKTTFKFTQLKDFQLFISSVHDKMNLSVNAELLRFE